MAGVVGEEQGRIWEGKIKITFFYIKERHKQEKIYVL